MVEEWVDIRSFARIHLDEWLTLQPENPYTDCLRILTDEPDERRDFLRVEKACRAIGDSPINAQLAELIKNAYLKKYDFITFEILDRMLNLVEPFDPTQTTLYQSILAHANQKKYEMGKEEGIEENKENVALVMLADGLDEQTVQRYTGLSLEKIRLLKQRLN